MEAEIKRARDWYWWLWLSPFLTIPTLIFVASLEPGFELLCAGRSSYCDWALVERLDLLSGVLVASLWHLILLKPATDKDSPFVHFHGLQGLCLAGLRTAVPLIAIIFFGFDFPALLAVPVLLISWLLGTLLAQHQATLGRCTLARWMGREDEVAVYQALKAKRRPGSKKTATATPDRWVNVIRFSDDPEQRRQALIQLELRNMVEEF